MPEWIAALPLTEPERLVAAAGLAGLVGLILGAVLGGWGKARLKAALAAASEKAERAQLLEERLAASDEMVAALRIEQAELSTTIAERDRAVRAEQERLDQRFKVVAGSVLADSREAFLSLARESFEKHKAMARADMDSLVKPLAETLDAYGRNLKDIEKARTEAYGSLKSELKSVVEAQGQVSAEARRLATALRDGAGVRGRWGEQQLKRILELAGMAARVDFDSQVNVTGPDGQKLKPDAVIRLPGERVIVVDAKAPMSAYIDARNESDEARREELFKTHAAQVRAQVKSLSRKNYAANFEEALDSVVMFLPTEDLAAAAWDHDPTLYEEAFNARVLIATPTTLFALAKAVAHVWRNEAAAKNAHEVARLGAELHKRLATMVGHIRKLGGSLDQSAKHYNAFLGSLERQVLPQARKFKGLEILPADADDLGVPATEESPRDPTAADFNTSPTLPAAAE